MNHYQQQLIGFLSLYVIKCFNMMKIGDKVRFLKEVGGGFVRGFSGKDTVLVEGEDGFEIPMPINECVVIETDSYNREIKSVDKQAASQEDAAVKPAKEVKKREEDEEEEKEPVVTFRPKPIETREGEVLNLLLAYVPTQAQVLTNMTFDAYLVNDSNYYLYFTYLCASGKSWRVRSRGLLEPNSKYLMEEFGHEDLNDMEHVCLQCLPFKEDKGFTLKQAVNVELRIDTVKFYKMHLFTPSIYFEEGSLRYDVVKNDLPVKEIFIDADELRRAIVGKKEAERPRMQPLPPKSVPPQVVEVDLHSAQLLDSTVGMDNTAILEYQLDVVRKTLDAYRDKKGQKIVFIHGKGEGVLRNALLKELKTKHPAYLVQDASFKEYGFGATMVVIR